MLGLACPRTRLLLFLRTFYEPELQKTAQETFRIEEVLERDEKGGKALVAWSGYPEKFDEWIPIKDVEEIAAKL